MFETKQKLLLSIKNIQWILDLFHSIRTNVKYWCNEWNLRNFCSYYLFFELLFVAVIIYCPQFFSSTVRDTWTSALIQSYLSFYGCDKNVMWAVFSGIFSKFIFFNVLHMKLPLRQQITCPSAGRVIIVAKLLFALC